MADRTEHPPEPMQLTRRDALVAVAASTVGVATVGALADELDAIGPPPGADEVVAGLEPVAEVVFPSEVEVTSGFLETYLVGREYDRAGYVAATSDLLDWLDRRSGRRFGRAFGDLPVERRDRLLRDLGVASTPPDPDGTTLERVRYYVVNQLLYALYTSPTGGRLLGNENPPGYPGGRAAYQEGPADG